MSSWKVICLAEACAILLVWLLWSGPTDIGTAPEERTSFVEAPPVLPALLADPSASAASPATEKEATTPSGTQLRPWSQPASGVLLLAEVTDEHGEPVRDGFGNCRQEGEESKQQLSLRSDHRLVLSGLKAGPLHVELRCEGFLPFQRTIDLAPEPGIQRTILRLERARRVLLRVHVSSGEPLEAWLLREWKWTHSNWRLVARLARQPLSGDLEALEHHQYGNELGEFLPADGRTPDLPKDCAGALDVRAQAPLHVGAWLGVAFLGTVPIADGVKEVTILLDERSLRSLAAEVRLRVVAADTGAPLKDARVSVSFPWGGGSTLRTGEDGRLTFPQLAPDQRDVVINLPDHAEGYRALELRPGERLDLGDVPLGRAGRIRARLLGADGTPLGQHVYQFFPTGSWTRPEEPRRISSRTDKEGWLDFRAGPERHQVIVGGGAHGVQAVVWERGIEEPGEREIRLAPGAEVRIRSTQSADLPRALWLLDADGRILSNYWTTSASPRTIVLAPGTYLLRVEDLDRNLLGTLDLRVPEGGGDLEVALP